MAPNELGKILGFSVKVLSKECAPDSLDCLNARIVLDDRDRWIEELEQCAGSAPRPGCRHTRQRHSAREWILDKEQGKPPLFKRDDRQEMRIRHTRNSVLCGRGQHEVRGRAQKVVERVFDLRVIVFPKFLHLPHRHPCLC